MSNFSQLKQQAISAAKASQWLVATEINLELLNQKPDDLGTLNRLGVAYFNLGETAKAKKAFQQVLEIDKTNQVAEKNLQRLKSKSGISPLFTDQLFIEEPGKTKVVELHRLASKDVLTSLSVGLPCQLKVKKRFVSVEAGGRYVGALPEDLSFRLTKLMDTGNQYQTNIWSNSATNCQVFIKEIFRAAINKSAASFPGSRSQISQTDEYDPFLTNDFLVEIVTEEELSEPLDSLLPTS